MILFVSNRQCFFNCLYTNFIVLFFCLFRKKLLFLIDIAKVWEKCLIVDWCFFQFLGWIFQSFKYPFLGGWISRLVNDLLGVMNDMPPVLFFFRCCILCSFLQLFLCCGINYATIWAEWNKLHFFHSVLNDLLLMLCCMVNYMMWNR